MGETRRKTLDPCTRAEPLHIRDNVQTHSRRQTIAGITTLKLKKSAEKPSMRIEKSRDSRKREAHKNENYAEVLQDQLHAYKTGLISALNDDLTETDAMLDESMGALSADFVKRCGIIETAAVGAQLTFQTETLECEDAQGEKTELVLGDEMDTFTQLFKSSKERLGQLWAEYEQTQRSIMELALSVLQERSVRIKYSSLDPKADTADPRLDEKKAQEQRQEAEKLYGTAMDDLSNLERAVGGLATKSLNTSTQILSDYKKQTEEIQKTILGLLNDIQG